MNTSRVGHGYLNKPSLVTEMLFFGTMFWQENADLLFHKTKVKGFKKDRFCNGERISLESKKRQLKPTLFPSGPGYKL